MQGSGAQEPGISREEPQGDGGEGINESVREGKKTALGNQTLAEVIADIRDEGNETAMMVRNLSGILGNCGRGWWEWRGGWWEWKGLKMLGR